MAEQPNTEQSEPRPVNQRGGPDPVALIAGLATLGVAAYLVSDGSRWLPPIDPRWVIAGGALLVGVLLLALSLRSGRR
jgi:protein-S-isoprenylcysteine O-methyltransferase Ste14